LYFLVLILICSTWLLSCGFCFFCVLLVIISSSGKCYPKKIAPFLFILPTVSATSFPVSQLPAPGIEAAVSGSATSGDENVVAVASCADAVRVYHIIFTSSTNAGC